MKIIHIIPGSGGSFYCGNCLRDRKYVDAIRDQGHQVVKIPLYLPLFANKHDIKDIPVFYGAVSVYLKQLYPVFRNAPHWFDRILNSKPLLKFAAGMAGSTRAKGLEEMTVSMLLGEEGQQNEELERMVDWIAENCNPEIIHLSNALLLGLAHKIKEKIKVPLVCSLQDEDTWIDVMKPKFQDMIWELMHEKARHVDAFIAVSNYYADVMKTRMKLSPVKVENLYLGVDPSDYQCINIENKNRSIGFISRMCYDFGLDILTDAFIMLKKSSRFEDIKLVLTGGSTGDDAGFLRNIKSKLRKAGLIKDVDFHEDFADEGRREFFNKVSILSVPARHKEAFGIYLLEAMASGIPVVQPAHGAFPEIIDLTRGGITYNPNTPENLAEAIESLFNNEDQLNQVSQNAYEGIQKHFNIKKQAEELVKLYRKVINSKE